jgi:hypothetical protein
MMYQLTDDGRKIRTIDELFVYVVQSYEKRNNKKKQYPLNTIAEK